MGNTHWSLVATATVVIIGSAAVCVAYIDVFGNETEESASASASTALSKSNSSNDGDAYTNSRFWIGISQDTAMVIWPLQLMAAAGFVVFVACLFMDARKRHGVIADKGVLSYLNGGASVIIFSVFFLCSYYWPYATRDYLDGGSSSGWDMTRTSLSLVGAAISAMLMVAGTFEAGMHPMAICGVLAFAMVVVLADGVGWNAKLIHSHYHNQVDAVHGSGLVDYSPVPNTGHNRKTLIIIKSQPSNVKSSVLRL